MAEDVDPWSDPTTWSPILQEAVKAQELGVIPFDLTLKYDHWNYSMSSFHPFAHCKKLISTVDVMKSILPEDAQGEIPVGFAIVGHVGNTLHLPVISNSSDQLSPSKSTRRIPSLQAPRRIRPYG